MYWAGIGILYPTHTTPANFDKSKYRCGVLTASHHNMEVLYISSHVTLFREEHEVGGYRRVDRKVDGEEGAMSLLRITIGMKNKQNLERDVEYGGWITVLTNSQDENDLSSDEFRYALRWGLGIPLKYPPLTCNGYSDPFMVEYT